MISAPVYNTIGQTYDVTRRADPAIVNQLFQLLQPKKGGLYLDMGCGSGNYTAALAEQGLNIQGIDLSGVMLAKARTKYPHMIFHQGDATELPFQDQVFSGVSCILATHHIQNNRKVAEEAFRVLDAKGRFVIFTATPEQMNQYWLCHYFPKMMQGSADLMTSLSELSICLKNAGFQTVEHDPFFVTPDLQDWFLQAGKYRPDIYLDPAVRAGISSFHLFAEPLELEQGLKLLARDIQSGAIQEVIAEYETDMGDYGFVVAQK